MTTLRDGFRRPPIAYRSAPFWSWNDRLEPAELARQIRDMKAHGMGGFFMHSRDGLETVYMSPEWLECIREAVRVAREEGMGAWLYDEDRWPSGAAGGLVSARGDAYRAKLVTVEEAAAPPAAGADLLALFAGQVGDGALSALRRVDPAAPGALGAGETFLIFRREISSRNERFNNESYSDNLNPDAVAAFLEITYEAYRREVGEDFGAAVPGIFTDEPNIYAAHVDSGLPMLPWTDGLPAFFAARRGYDLLDVLPWLFYEGEGACQARHDYWWTITERFVAAYSKQLSDWCEQQGVAFTGHYLYEQEMGLGIQRGGATMPHLRYQHVPGIDMLTEQNHENLTIKEATSVAHQFGRDWVLSETYGCSSWEFTFEGQKWVGDWQYVQGVNLRCQHLALYSIRGCRKRDYPPAFSYQTTWWKYNPVVEDYFARLGLVGSAGQPVRDVLMLHPIATGWSIVGQSDDSVALANHYSEALNDFARAALATHYDFDFGDEMIMAEAGGVDGGALRVGQATYRVVVIPPDTRTLLASTVDLLDQFLDAGGTVIAVEPTPTMIEGRPDVRLAELLARRGVTVLPDRSGLQAALEAHLPRRVSLRTVPGQEAAAVLAMQRALDDGGYAYMLFNGDRHSGQVLDMALEGSGRLEEWDPLTGEVRPIAAEERDGRLCFRAEMGPAASRLYVVDPAGEPFAPPAEPLRDIRRYGRGLVGTYLGPTCAFTRTDPNVLTLDTCQYRLEEGAWSEEMEVWRAQHAVREALGMPPNYRNGLPQRYGWARQPHAADGARLALRFTIDVDVAPSGPLYLLVEGAPQFTILLNGRPVPTEVVGWYLDRAFHKVPLPGLQAGENVLELSCAYTNYMEIEDCFLLGDFGVTRDRRIVAEPARLHFGDWTTQGYPHYAGSMIYHGSLEFDPAEGPVRVWLGEYEAVHVAVHVNGEVVGHIPWADANGLDITSSLRLGHNDIGIEVVSSPRNMLGPLHLATGREAWTDWRSFRRTDETYTPDYVLKAWGLIGQVRLGRN
ncbi:MAG: hypothetical protein GX657_00785 [Chloroflexi bacterium]|nr:hypothetical protein [Chloroflexota bacterium]